MNLRFLPLGLVLLGFAIAPLAEVKAATLPPPTLDPAGGALAAPVKVRVRSAAAGASIHVTLDGAEPTPRDTEVDSGAEVVIDEPLTLKAKAWLPDGTASATTAAVFALKPVNGNGATFVEQAVPAVLATGQRQTVEVTMRNIGKLPWIPATHTLAAARAKDGLLWTVSAPPLSEAVATWKTATFRVTIIAPSVPGTYNLSFRMQSGSQAFGEASPVLRVAVLSPADFQRETKANGDGTTRTAETPTVPKNPGLAPLSQGASEALVKAKANLTPTQAENLQRLVRELQRSGRSFRYLQSIGFTQTEADFAKLIADNPGLFRSVRIVRRDEKGQRVIPGWPGIALQGKR